jgi:hypothetical protein
MNMVRIRRTGLLIATVTFVFAMVAAFIVEGLGLAVIVAVAGVVAAMFIVPVLAIFEEERDLPEARAHRTRLH